MAAYSTPRRDLADQRTAGKPGGCRPFEIGGMETADHPRGDTGGFMRMMG
jgi:hypothetical protein